MLIDYTPENQETQRFEFRPGRVRMAEQAVIEKLYSKEAGAKKSFIEFTQDIREGYAAAIRVLLFTVLRRLHPSIRFEDVDPLGDEVEIRLEKAELEEMRDNALAVGDFPGRDAFIARMDFEIEHAPDGDPGSPGKATGSSSSTATGNSPARSRKRGSSTT